MAGGGVLADIGVHALDRLLWWLGDYRSVAYCDDAEGGVEGDCKLELELKSGAVGTVELSRSRNLRNTCVIRGDRATLEFETKWNPIFRLKMKNKDLLLNGRASHEGGEEEEIMDLYRIQIQDFVDSINQKREPFISGGEAKRAIALIEACYANRTPWHLDWVSSSQPNSCLVS